MILVAGATGSLGGRIARGLLEEGVAVRALVRPGSDHAFLRDAGVELAFGDLTQPATLDRACAGVRSVVTTASATKRGDDSVENVDLRGNVNLIDAARDAGVRRFVLVSTLGASEDSPVPAFRAKAGAERHLRESGMDYTILQPNALMDVWFSMLVEAPARAGLPVTLVGDSTRRHSFIAEADVAAFSLAALRNPVARNVTLVLGGPEAVRFTDVVRAYERAAGREIPIQRVAPGEPIPGTPEPVWGFAAALESYDSLVPMEETARTYGVTLTSVGELAKSRWAAGWPVPSPAPGAPA